MALVRYEPWTVVSQLQEEINRAFSNVSDTSTGSNSSSATADWAPPVDIAEYSDQFELFVDLPGVDPKSVEITLDNDVLTLSGERPIEKRAGDNHQLMSQRNERSHGRFHRRFILPDTVDTERVTAKGRDGVLELTIGKQHKAQPRRIKVAA
jgi:HSP20 family protein